MVGPCVRGTLCGCSLQAGTKIIALLHIGVLVFYVLDVFLILDDYVDKANNRQEGEPYGSFKVDIDVLRQELEIWKWFEVALVLCDFIATVILFIVVFKRYRGRCLRVFIVTWCSFTMILCFFNTSLYIFTSVRLKKTNSMVRFGSLVLLVCIAVYFIVIVDSYGEELKQQSEDERDNEGDEEASTFRSKRSRKQSLAITYTRVHRTQPAPVVNKESTAEKDQEYSQRRAEKT